MNPQLKKIAEVLNQVPWLPVGIIAGVLLVIGIIIVIVRRRQAKKSGTRAITSGALVAIWRSFLAQIPREFRRYVLHFQGFIVLGESGSGKSLLIGKYTDWKGQAAQFYPSYTSDPTFQLYLGSRALVQELPPSLLADTSPRARAALVNVWKKTCSKRPPVVVVTVSAAALREATPDSLRSQAQTLRGKINILSRIANHPVRTRVVLTHMDQVDGYLAFSEFVEKQEIPHQIALQPDAPALGLASCLEPYEEYLPLALKTLPAKSYLKVLTFLSKAPATFENLGILLSTLREADPRSFVPELKELYLTSHASGGPSAVSNPFETSWTAHGQAIERAIAARHKLITTVVAILGVVWLLAGFARERERHKVAKTALENFVKWQDAKDSPAGETELALAEFASGRKGDKLSWLLPSYSSGTADQMAKRFVTAIREKYLLPRAQELRTSANGHETGLYLLALIYASRDDELGKFILDGRTAEFASALKLPEAMVVAYVHDSATPFLETVAVGELPYERKPILVAQLETWHSFFLELKGALAGSAVTPDKLTHFQDMANELRDGIAAVERRRTAKDLFRMLSADPRFPRATFARFDEDFRLPMWLLEQRQQFVDVLDLIRETRMAVPTLARQSLAELVIRLRGVQALSDLEAKAIQVTLEDKTYSVDVSRWNRVINNGKARTLVQRFIQENQRSGYKIFFAASGAYPEVAMKPPAASEFLFPGKGVVPGEFTKAAYDREVVPQIGQFEQLIDAVDLDRDIRDELRNLVSGAADQYAGEYDRQWRRYYESWSIQADALGSLKIILGQMKLPASRFQEFFQSVVDNTSLEPSSSPYLRSLGERMAAFRPIAQLLQTGGPKTPSELENYRAILARMLSDLESGTQLPESTTQAGAAADAKKQQVDFESLLTPLAKLSYDIVREHRDSYQRLVEAWLKNAGVVDPWRAPFLQPIKLVEKLGRSDMEAVVSKSWTQRVRIAVVPLVDKFPFNARSPSTATPQDIEGALQPNTGAFWTAFRGFVGPLCVQEQSGRWKPMRALETSFTWPGDLFSVTNHLQVLTAALWDKDAVPRQLQLTVRAEPLPEPVPGRTVVLSFLSSGKSTVFGFNQKPLWQTLSVEWTARASAQVGIQLGDAATGERKNRELTEPESYWAFYRLLTKEPQEQKDVAIWNLSRNTAELPPIILQFTFQEDPWRLFKIPTFERTDEHAAK